LAEMISDMEKKEEKILNGEDAFRLYAAERRGRDLLLF